MHPVNTIDTIDAVLLNAEVHVLFAQYRTAAATSGIQVEAELCDFVQTVSKGDRGGASLLEAVIGVLKACIWNHTTTWEEKMALAGECRMLSANEIQALAQERHAPTDRA